MTCLIALSASQLQTGNVTQLSISHGMQTETDPFPHGLELPPAETAHLFSTA